MCDKKNCKFNVVTEILVNRYISIGILPRITCTVTNSYQILRRCNYTQRNLIKSTRNQIVLTIFLLIWNQTDVCLVRNQSQNGKYNLISIWFNKISKSFACRVDRVGVWHLCHSFLTSFPRYIYIYICFFFKYIFIYFPR